MSVVRCHGADLYYEDHGAGQPLVFLHGAAAGLRYFEPQLTGLSDAYRVIGVDFRGHGRSEKTDLGHTIPQYARDVRAFLEELALEDVVVIGWSLGAIVSWEYVDQYGTDRIRGLVDVDMEPSPFQREGYDHGTYSLDWLREVAERLQTGPYELFERSTERLLKEPPSRELRTMMFDEQSRCPSAIQGAMLPELFRDYRDVLPRIDVPTLVCAGADEKWRSVAAVNAVAERVPDARFERFEGSGHCITVEEPDRFNQVLRDFVDGL